ncbi:MAG TPA: hypothetical protein VKG85_00585 [Actinomycetes bacterium]|nr:hypothetical protein [Actinomycetes bacterium]
MSSQQPAGAGDRRQESAERSGRTEPTVLSVPVADRLVLFVGLPLLGAAVGLVLPVVARWALGLSTGLPMRPLFRLIAAVDRPLEIAIEVGICVLVGLGIAIAAMREATRLTLTDTELRVSTEAGGRTLARADIASVFLDGKTLVALDHESRQLVRETHEMPKPALAAAFERHGYPWQDADPHADRYREWLADAPELPPAVNAVLAARQVALYKKAHQEAGQLRTAVQNLGFVVRDEGARQFWRPLVRSGES